MDTEITKAITPPKLWLLRIYIKLISVIVPLILVTYIIVTIANLSNQINEYYVSKDLIDILVGYFGFYLVWLSFVILLISEIINLFLNIHDYTEDMAKKAVNPNFALDLDAEKEKNKDTSISAIITIAIIILSIFFSLININRQNNHGNQSVEIPIQYHDKDNNLNNYH